MESFNAKLFKADEMATKAREELAVRKVTYHTYSSPLNKDHTIRQSQDCIYRTWQYNVNYLMNIVALQGVSLS